MSRSRLIICLWTVLLLLGSTAVSQGAASPAPTVSGQRLGRPGEIVLRADDRVSSLHVPRRVRPAGSGVFEQTVTITVRYLNQGETSGNYTCETWDPAAKAAFQYTVDIWAEQLTSPVPVVVEACWTALGAGILGSAGAADYYRDFAGAPKGGTWYPMALAEALAGTQLNGASEPEINARLNSNFTSWYYGTDGNPPSNKYDLASVVLHEICHGLGFIGTMWVEGLVGSWGWETPYPIVFDHYLENGNGQSLKDDFTNYTIALGNQLRGLGNGVYFDGSEANAANGGAPVRLYAPVSWNPGSSIYHVDETFDGTENALMTYSISKGEVNHDPGPVTRGIMADLGWTVLTEPDVAISKQLAGPYDPAPGQAVTYTLSIENMGVAAATNVVISDALPVEVLAPTWSSSASLSGLALRGGTRYVWDLASLPAGASGTITIAGTISPSLPTDYALWNTVSVACDEAENTANNRGMALAGGERAYLPLVVRGY